jgi:hypothetical protein
MANDVAHAIVMQAGLKADQEERVKKENFCEAAVSNHYNVCIEMIAKAPEPQIQKRFHFGCKSFYFVYGDMYTAIDDDVFRPKRFINISKNKDTILPVLVHHFAHQHCNIQDPDNVCLQMTITSPIYACKKSTRERLYFKEWEHLETLFYDKSTDVREMIEHAFCYISSIEER